MRSDSQISVGLDRRLPMRRDAWMTLLHLLAVGVVFGLLNLKAPAGYSWIFLGAVFVAMLAVPRFARLAVAKGIVSRPGGRQNHARTTPMLGGVIVFGVVAAGLLAIGLAGDTLAFGALAGGALVFGVGLIDDVRGVPPRAKIAVQALAGAILLMSGFELESLSLAPLGSIELGYFGPVLIVGWVVIGTNAFNIVDGLDGLAASIALLAALTFAVFGVWSVAMLALAGGLMGFLYYNLPRARVFMGDAGSLFLGFMVSAGVLLLPADKLVPYGLAIFAYPIGDVVLTVTRRIVRGQPIFRPDRSHIHHKALSHLGSHAPVLLLAVLFAAVEILVAIAYPGLPAVIAVVIGWAAIAFLLVGAGQYNLSTVMATREPVQRLHVVTRYVRDSIRLASRPRHVATALQHLVEGMGLSRLALPAFDVDLTNRLRAFGDLRQHRVGVVTGEAIWSDERCTYDPRVEIERETTVVQIVLQASERLSYLTTDDHLTTVDLPVPSGVSIEDEDTPRDAADEDRLRESSQPGR